MRLGKGDWLTVALFSTVAARLARALRQTNQVNAAADLDKS